MAKVSAVDNTEDLMTDTELADESLSTEVIRKTTWETAIIAELVEMISLLDKMLAKLHKSS
ncbi:MAG TPA: hypothetical protein VLB01_01385 [Thermodesulfobacteriota bacterium]|nr:hypothetical protein [Thermodesulfobacteriota bacterium]